MCGAVHLSIDSYGGRNKQAFATEDPALQQWEANKREGSRAGEDGDMPEKSRVCVTCLLKIILLGLKKTKWVQQVNEA